MTAERATLDRRLANFRATLAGGGAARDGRAEPPPAARPDLAERMAAALEGEVIREGRSAYVRVEWEGIDVPVDRHRLAALPGQPPADAPLVCLDTETTGLGTAAGTYAFLIGLGWWAGERFRTVQLLLPDQSHEPAVLAAVERHIPADAWLVSYNGRGFDWPLLVTRYRMARRTAPPHAGHLDLLPLVRRLFRHRMVDARLRTVEEALLRLTRHEDVEGWEIPGRYLDFLRTGLAQPLAVVARHNAEDVRSLGRLVGHVEASLGDASARRLADPGDIAGLARLYLRDRQLESALECLETALGAIGPAATRSAGRRAVGARESAPATVPARRGPPPAPDDWWSPRRAPDFGGRAPLRREAEQLEASPWSEERLLVERAHVLRRLGRLDEAAETWRDLSYGTGRLAAVAAVELAKLREHRLGDPAGALEAVRRGWTVLERRRRLGRPEPRLEEDLVRRGRRLRSRLEPAHGRDDPVGRATAPGGVTGLAPAMARSGASMP